MSGKKPDPGQIERAARLREQIEHIQREGPTAEPEDSPKPADRSANSPKLSPRDFIHKRMRELNKK
jgi:hypothetical protein